MLGAHRDIQADGQVGLDRTQGRLQLLHHRDRLDPLGVRGPVLATGVHASLDERGGQATEVVKEVCHATIISNTHSISNGFPELVDFLWVPATLET